MKRACMGLMLLASLLASSARAAVILLYHHVDATTPASTSVTPEQFAEHLQRLEDEGFQVLRLDRLLERVQQGANPAERLAAVTFDDAFSSIHHTAVPLLEQRGWSAAVFVATAAVGQGPRMMTVPQLQDLHRRGHLIVNHGQSHGHLVRRLPEQSLSDWQVMLRQEIEGAQATLTGWLDAAPPKLFAYPFGEQTPALQAQLRELGYVGLSQRSGALDGTVNWQDVPRIPVNRQHADWRRLRDKVLALPMPVLAQEPASSLTFEPRPDWMLRLPQALQGRVQCFLGSPQPLGWQRSGDHVLLTVSLSRDLPPGRSTVNCTAPAGDGRFYWISRQWMHAPGGHWYQE